MKTIDTDPALPETPPAEKAVLAPVFNKRAREVSEVEIKYLVSDTAPHAFEQIEHFFTKKGWIAAKKEPNHLLSRQLDTANKTLLKQGHTLRVRGTCQEGNLDNVVMPDICLKTGKTSDSSGALRRGEYETRIKDFENIDIKALLDRYPKEKYPEVHQALENAGQQDIKELFRIDCLRQRYVIEIPESETGLKNKRFFAELMLDDIAFILDLPGLDAPVLFHSEREVECEALFKACAYDHSPNAHRHVSSLDIDDEELNHALQVFADILTKEALPGSLTLADEGKAERGFKRRQQFFDTLGQDVPAIPVPEEKPLTFIFLFHAKNAPEQEEETSLDVPGSLLFADPKRIIALRR